MRSKSELFACHSVVNQTSSFVNKTYLRSQVLTWQRGRVISFATLGGSAKRRMVIKSGKIPHSVLSLALTEDQPASQ